MAFSKRSGGSKRPQYSISTSVFVRKGKYIKGPSFGLWDADSGPMARGSVKDGYLEELQDFLSKAAKREQSVSFALFKNKKKVEKDEDDDDDDDSEEEDEEDDAETEEEEEEDEKASKKSKKKSSDRSSKSGKKSSKGSKKDWDFDDDDE